MTKSRANRVLENGVWRYLDQIDAEYVLFSMPEYSIEAVDDFIDSGKPPEEAIPTLREMRHNGLQAYIGKNIQLMEAHLRGLYMACHAAGMIDAARTGDKFKQGRKPLTSGPIRKAIARLLAKSPSMKNAELWEAVKAKPPKGWQVFDNRCGKYIEGPKASDGMKYSRFCNIAADERNPRES